MFAWAGIAGMVFVATYLVMVRLHVGQRADFSAFEGRKATSLWARRGAAAILQVVAPAVVVMITAGAAFRALRDRGTRAMCTAIAVPPVVALLAASLKQVLPRAELLPEWWVSPTNSYPSGHVAALTAAVLVAVTSSRPRWRGAISFAGAILLVIGVVGIGASGWHRPSDLVGGLALAVIVSALLHGEILDGWRLDTEQRPEAWFDRRRPVIVVAGLLILGVLVCYIVIRLGGRPTYGSFPAHLAVALVIVALAVATVVVHSALAQQTDAALTRATPSVVRDVGSTSILRDPWHSESREIDLTSGTVNEVRLAVVGCGYWGRNLVRTFAETGALRCVVDADGATASAMSESFGVTSCSLAEMLADPEIDAVAIAVPAKQHAEVALAAIDAGKHVFVEKPLALDVTDAAKVVDAADRAGVTLMVGHLLQYHPAFLRLQQMVEAGELGEIRYLYSNRLNLGKIRREENILWSFAPHDLSMLIALVGEGPDRVTAVGSTFISDNVPDVTTTHLTFPSGPRAHVFVSWLHPFKEQRLVVVGSEAMAVFDDTAPWESKLVVFEHAVTWDGANPVPVRGEPRPIPIAESEPLRLECEHFLNAVLTGSAPRTDGREGLEVLRVLEAAEQSLRAEGSTVHPSMAGPEVSHTASIHPSAYVDGDVEIGSGTRVWHFSHVLSGSRIGEDCTLGQNVVVGPAVHIGDRCRIQNNVSVYEGVTLEDGVFCGPSCVFTNVYNPRAEVSRKDEFRPTVVRRGATIGANATIVCGNEIGAYSFIAAGSVVTGDVAPHALMIGSPARQVGWMSHDGERLGDDLVCLRSGRRYKVEDGNLIELGGS